MQPNQIVSRDEWVAARTDFLAKEKAHMRAGDLLAAERRSLPWLKVEKSYVFDTAQGRRSLAELFGDCGQLIVHHLMFGAHDGGPRLPWMFVPKRNTSTSPRSTWSTIT